MTDETARASRARNERSSSRNKAQSTRNLPEFHEQMVALIDGAAAVARQLGNLPPGKRVIIHKREAEYLQLVPHELLKEITTLAIRRVKMRDGHDYMQRGDIDWAVQRLVVGKRSSVGLTLLNSIGGILLGAGIPIITTPIIENSALGTGGIILAGALLIPGVVCLSLALSFSVFRR